MADRNIHNSIHTDSPNNSRVTTPHSNNAARSTTAHPASGSRSTTPHPPIERCAALHSSVPDQSSKAEVSGRATTPHNFEDSSVSLPPVGDVRRTTPHASAPVQSRDAAVSGRVTAPHDFGNGGVSSQPTYDIRRTTPHNDNVDLPAESVSVSNQSSIFNLPENTHITNEIIITGKLRQINPSGEAVLYKCRIDGHNEEYIIKIYTREFNDKEIEAKRNVIQALKDVPVVAQVVRFGKYAGYYYEVLLYYHNGSLADRLHEKTFSEKEIRKDILPKLNEAIHQIHQVNVIHADIKPANILFTEDKKNFVLIDFGVAKYTNGRQLVTQAGRTADYSATELIYGKVAKESDYYSLGISLYELFTGKTPTKDLEDTEVDVSLHFYNDGRIRHPNGMSDNFYALLLQLTYPSLSDDEQTDDFPIYTRWSYSQVKKWLSIPQLPEEKIDEILRRKRKADRLILSFPYGNKLYDSVNALVNALANSNVTDAYRYIMADTASFGETLRNLKKNDDLRVRQFATELIKKHESFKKSVPKSIPNEEKVILFYYTFSENLDVLYTTFSKPFKAKHLDELGKDLLEVLSRSNWTDRIQTYIPLLEHGLLDRYLSQRDNKDLTPVERHLSELLESLCQIARTDKTTAFCAMAYAFSGRNTPFKQGNRQFQNIYDLEEKIADLEQNPQELFCLITPLLSDAHHLSPQFAGWLINQNVRYEDISF